MFHWHIALHKQQSTCCHHTLVHCETCCQPPALLAQTPNNGCYRQRLERDASLHWMHLSIGDLLSILLLKSSSILSKMSVFLILRPGTHGRYPHWTCEENFVMVCNGFAPEVNWVCNWSLEYDAVWYWHIPIQFKTWSLGSALVRMFGQILWWRLQSLKFPEWTKWNGLVQSFLWAHLKLDTLDIQNELLLSSAPPLLSLSNFERDRGWALFETGRLLNALRCSQHHSNAAAGQETCMLSVSVTVLPPRVAAPVRPRYTLRAQGTGGRRLAQHT